MRLDVLLETFDVHWGELVAAARTAEQVGIDGLWVNDHLAGGVQGAGHVLECWTVLSALAEAVAGFGPRMASVAGRVGDGFCAPLGPHFPALVAAAKRARASAGADADTLLVVGSLGAVPRDGDVLPGVGLDRLVVAVGRPLETSI